MLTSRDGDIFTAAAESGLRPEEILDFSGTMNPCPLPEAFSAHVQEALKCLEHYPDPEARSLRKSAAALYGVSPDEVSAGNGVTEFIYAIPRALRPRRAVIVAPCAQDCWRACDAVGAEPEGVPASETHEFIPDAAQLEMRLSGTDMVFIGNPNDPTGVALPADAVRALAKRFPAVTFVVDESFAEFVPESADVSFLRGGRPDNVILLRSPSPLLGLPGLRAGFMIASPEVGGRVGRAREPWPIGSLALCLAEKLLASGTDIAAVRQNVIAERERLRDEFSRMAGLRVFRSQTNFLLLKITRPGLTSAQVCERLLKQRILIRNAAGFRGLDGKFVRVAVRGATDNDRLVAGFRNALEESRWK